LAGGGNVTGSGRFRGVETNGPGKGHEIHATAGKEYDGSFRDSQALRSLKVIPQSEADKTVPLLPDCFPVPRGVA
jgi:hypothetical protein